MPQQPECDPMQPHNNADALRSLETVQRIRKLAFAVAGLIAGGALLLGKSRFASGSLPHEIIEYVGLLLIFACIAGRLWASLYIAGRKKLELVKVGPYSISRNPLYLFSILGAAGVGAATGSLTGMALAAIMCGSIFSIVIIKEEKFLRGRFGAEFDAYAAQVPRLLPRLSGLKTSQDASINPQLIMKNFRDSALFLIAIPVIEGIEELQEFGWLPVYFVFP